MNRIVPLFFFLLIPGLLLADSPYFTENKGQLEGRVKYYSQLKHQNIIIFQNGFAYDNFIWNGDSSHHHRVEIFFKGAHKKSTFQSENQLSYYENFYREHKEITFVKSYGEIINKDIYPGIDIRYTFNESGFKYDMIVHPGAHLNQIKMEIKGAPVFLKDGTLIYSLSLGNLKENIPMSFLKESGKIIEVNYIQIGQNEFGFKSKKFDFNETLIIDPVPNLVWGTYVGGSGADEFLSSDLDVSDNIYSGGKSSSTSNISTSGAYQTTYVGSNDGILSKFSSSGVRLWSTYYGGSGYDDIRRVKINGYNEVICVANSTSSGIATSGSHQSTHGGNYDGMVLKFSENGTRIWATYFGSSSIEDMYGLVLDNHQNIYIGGKSSSTGLATSGAYKTTNSGGEDALIVSFNNSGALRWSTYLGGSGQDYVRGMVQHTDLKMYITGFTRSTSGIAYNAAHQSTYGGGDDAFYLKIDTTGKVSWVNYMGGSGVDYATEIVSLNEALWFCGQTTSSNKITTSGSYQSSYIGGTDGFIFKFDTAGK